VVLPGRLTLSSVAVVFNAPSTKDFVFGCWGRCFKVLGFNVGFNFILFLILLTTLIFIGLFYLGFRNPRAVPGKLQSLTEAGIEFVREQVAIPMLGHDADRFMPLLATLFFFILIANLFEVTPGFNLAPTSRVAIPLVLAAISWVTYNYQGVRKHGLLGYLRFTCIIYAAPWWLRYTLLPLIEFFSNIIIRPITLTVRLTANFLAGHFLLAIFFLGTIFFLQDAPHHLYIPLIPGLVSFAMSLLMVGFEIFVAILQAYIFAILTASYIGGVLAEDH